MSILKNILMILLIINNFCMCNTKYTYKINFLGIHVANCYYSVSDTTIYSKEAYNIHYKVNTKKFYNLFFKIDNNYSIILEKNNYRTLYYRKKTYQPKLLSEIKTTYDNDKVKYSNKFEIKPDEINIFGLLYLLSQNLSEKLNKYNIIDREGKKYTYSINKQEDDAYILNLIDLDPNEKGLIEHTDIFNWALFLPKTTKKIYFNDAMKIISKCEFNKGILKITAELENNIK